MAEPPPTPPPAYPPAINPLAAIRGYAEMTRTRVAHGTPIYRWQTEIMRIVDRLVAEAWKTFREHPPH